MLEARARITLIASVVLTKAAAAAKDSSETNYSTPQTACPLYMVVFKNHPWASEMQQSQWIPAFPIADREKIWYNL